MYPNLKDHSVACLRVCVITITIVVEYCWICELYIITATILVWYRYCQRLLLTVYYHHHSPCLILSLLVNLLIGYCFYGWKQSQNYDNKADIYSLAIIYWEMWYGEDAADYIRHRLTGPLEDAIKGGLRPSLLTPTPTPDHWTDLITRSWDFEPTRRPGIAQHHKFFEDFVKDTRKA